MSPFGICDSRICTKEPESAEDTAYLYDGTLEGLLSAVFLAYELHEEPNDVVRVGLYNPRLGQRMVEVETDFSRADRVRRGIVRVCGKATFTAVARASTCDDYDMGAKMLRFVRYAMSRPAEMRGIPVLDELAEPAVADIVELNRRVANECERMRQFVRFNRLENGLWFARFKPSASIVPLIMGYFAGRMGGEPFVIYDEAHRMAGVHDGKKWQVALDVDVKPGEVIPTAEDAVMQHAWKLFYDSLAIDARYNPELRRHFMPIRFWSNLPEMQPRQKGLA